MVINVAAFVEDEKIKNELLYYTEIRNKVLDECYTIPGYAELSPAEKVKIYDSIMKKYKPI